MRTRQERLERIADRHEYKADKATIEATRRAKGADASEEATGIPFGQPILVGHHSEARHRAAMKRIDTNMRKCIEASKEADNHTNLASQAESAIERGEGYGAYGISGRDADAIELLEARIAKDTAESERMKAANKAWRKAAVGSKPKEYYLPYELTSLSANVRRLKQRIEFIKKQREIAARDEDKEIQGPGFTITTNAEYMTREIRFDERQSSETTTWLKQRGFRWIRSAECWSRSINSTTQWHIEELKKRLTPA